MRTGPAVLLALCSCATTEATDETDQAVAAIAETLRPAGGGGELGVIVDAALLVRGGQPANAAPGAVHDYAVRCRDSANRPLPCDARTANADVASSWSSAVTASAGTWIANDLTPHGLRLDGESSLATTGAVLDASYRNLYVGRDEPWPRAGLVRYEVTVDRARAGVRRDHRVHADLSFHASGRATIVLSDHEYELDLTTTTLEFVR